MRRLLITGAQGMLGSALQTSFGDKFEIIAASRSDLNIESFQEARSFIQKTKPDIIIHAAAYTNVEEAERTPEACYKINYNGTLHLINAAKGLQTKFIYISSTGCYGAYKEESYSEFDEVAPTTVYHKSKIAGENVVKDLCDDFLIIRTGWLFGGSTNHKKNFVYNRYKEAIANTRITSDPFQKGNPTNTEDVANQIEALIDQDIRGMFNVVAEGNCTRYEYVKAIVEAFDLPCEVVPAGKPFERVAKVSSNEAASNFNLSQLGLNVMPEWKESLRRYVRSIQSYV
jgi:dTDP-4-dehydrorhamnose reductase